MFRDEVMEVLLKIGVPANIKGFVYICDALQLFNEDPYYSDGKICTLYYKIAKQHDTTPSRVERAIRHAFETALTKGNVSMVEKYLDLNNTQNSCQMKKLYFRIKQEERLQQQQCRCNVKECEIRQQIYMEAFSTFCRELEGFMNEQKEEKNHQFV